MNTPFFKLSEYSLIAALIAAVLALGLYLAYLASGLRAARLQTAGGPAIRGGTLGLVVGPTTAGFGRYGTILGWLSFAFLTAWLVLRTVATGHGPFANMYEFSVAFAWGVLGAYYFFERSYGQRVLGLVALPVTIAMLVFAITIPNGSTIEPLVPALKNNLLLTVHVAVAIVAYGSFSIAFAAAMLFLFQQRLADRVVAVGSIASAVVLVVAVVRGWELAPTLGWGGAAFAVAGALVWLVSRSRAIDPNVGVWGLPKPDVLDEISYKAVVVGYPFLSLTIILGAIWAETAWGTYWSWDPKETASLVTWLIYGAYLHARVVRGWRGSRSAYLLLLGFAATLFTYFGNYFFGGLHSYAGLDK